MCGNNKMKFLVGFFSDVSGFTFYHVVLIHQTPWIHMVMHCFYSCFIVTLYGHIIYYDTSVGLLLLYYQVLLQLMTGEFCAVILYCPFRFVLVSVLDLHLHVVVFTYV